MPESGAGLAVSAGVSVDEVDSGCCIRKILSAVPEIREPQSLAPIASPEAGRNKQFRRGDTVMKR